MSKMMEQTVETPGPVGLSPISSSLSIAFLYLGKPELEQPKSKKGAEALGMCHEVDANVARTTALGV